jgi:hypothetical protein
LKQRSRGRNNNNNGGGGGKKHMPPRNQTYDSNGPDIRIRGNAHQVLEKYLTMARDCTLQGDRVAAENYYQHAEHYFRVINSQNQANGRPNERALPTPADDQMTGDLDGDEGEDGDYEGEEGSSEQQTAPERPPVAEVHQAAPVKVQQAAPAEVQQSAPADVQQAASAEEQPKPEAPVARRRRQPRERVERPERTEERTEEQGEAAEA